MLSWFSPRPLVLVICTANICRSPTAAALLRHELKRRGAKNLCRVRSAGTNVGTPGHAPDSRMVRLAKSVGVSLRGEHAQAITRRLLRDAQLIVVMEPRHLDAVCELCPDLRGPDKHRLALLGAFSPALESDIIADPYFASRAAIELVFGQLRDATAGLAEALISNDLSLK